MSVASAAESASTTPGLTKQATLSTRPPAGSPASAPAKPDDLAHTQKIGEVALDLGPSEAGIGRIRVSNSTVSLAMSVPFAVAIDGAAFQHHGRPHSAGIARCSSNPSATAPSRSWSG